MTRTLLPFGTGLALGLVVLVARHGVDIVGLSLMVCLFAILSVAWWFGQHVFNEHKPWITVLWKRLNAHIPAPLQRPFTLWKRLRWGQARKKEHIYLLQREITALGEELEALSVSWHQARNKYLARRFTNKHLNNQPAFTPVEPHQAFVIEYHMLIKSLKHYGTPEKHARLKQGDLNFYSEWFGDLKLRFRAFREQYSLQLENVNRALISASAFQEQFIVTYQPRERYTDYWTYYGSYCALEDLLREGCVQPESLLPLMLDLQNHLDGFLARQ